MTMPNAKVIHQLLTDLADAKTWPANLKKNRGQGIDVNQDIEAAANRIEGLEKYAKQLMKTLGCTNPKTRSIYQGMADMLIKWYAFIDDLD
jgi:hypothetical protein